MLAKNLVRGFHPRDLEIFCRDHGFNGPFRNWISNLTNKLTHHMKDRVDSSHLTKFDAFRVNKDQVMELETWSKIHTNDL